MTDDPRERFISRAGQGRIKRRGLPPAGSPPRLTVDQMQRIMIEVDRGVPAEQSKVTGPAAATFRERVTREIRAAKAKHPNYQLHIQAEIPEL